jgi:hypothetical protein
MKPWVLLLTLWRRVTHSFTTESTEGTEKKEKRPILVASLRIFSVFSR